MMPLKHYNLAAVLLLLLGGYDMPKAAIAPDRTRLGKLRRKINR